MVNYMLNVTGLNVRRGKERKGEREGERERDLTDHEFPIR